MVVNYGKFYTVTPHARVWAGDWYTCAGDKLKTSVDGQCVFPEASSGVSAAQTWRGALLKLLPDWRWPFGTAASVVAVSQRTDTRKADWWHGQLGLEKTGQGWWWRGRRYWEGQDSCCCARHSHCQSSITERKRCMSSTFQWSSSTPCSSLLNLLGYFSPYSVFSLKLSSFFRNVGALRSEPFLVLQGKEVVGLKFLLDM